MYIIGKIGFNIIHLILGQVYLFGRNMKQFSTFRKILNNLESNVYKKCGMKRFDLDY